MRNFIVTIDGKSYNVAVEEVGAEQEAPATPIEFESGEKILSPFPGLIKKLLVADGSTVKKDQPVIVLEAMKMDNDITAPCSGKISFYVAEGANVESSAVLAIIE